ncbi:MAG TPA: CHASE2 domain-containing protein [Rhizomicrobium sp.]|jgi:hypothetical protein|nr:CHASE2 domain-containing protein [Rhizomicrobium sp.]
MNAAEVTQSRTRVGRAIARARKPNRDHMEALKKRMPFWFVFTTLFVLAAWQILLNPFGFSSVIQRYTQDISDLLITGPFYPTSGHDQISVALTEEDTLQALNEPWPWSYGAHARLLDALLAYKPRAVIVDYLFVDNRNDDTLADLVTEIHRYQAAHIPIYFEGGRDVPFGEAPLRPEIAATGVPVLDPSILVNNGVVRQYPTTGECFGLHRAGKQCLSLALSVYRSLAKRDAHIPPLQVNTDGLMELVWGTNTDPYNRKWRTVTGENGATLSCDDHMGFFSRIFAAFFDADSVRQRCPYATILPVEELVKGVNDPDFPKIIPGRVIFYGAALEGAQDKSFTPVSGLQANVFVHAMALDNLLTYGGKPEQDVVTLFGKTYESDPVQVAAIAPVILILSWLHMRRKRRAETKNAKHHDVSATVEYFLDKGLEMAWHWLAFFLALGAGLALTLAVGLSVANWVEVVFVSVELAAMLLIGVPDALWGYLHHVAGGVPDLQQT